MSNSDAQILYVHTQKYSSLYIPSMISSMSYLFTDGLLLWIWKISSGGSRFMSY